MRSIVCRMLFSRAEVYFDYKRIENNFQCAIRERIPAPLTASLYNSDYLYFCHEKAILKSIYVCDNGLKVGHQRNLYAICRRGQRKIDVLARNRPSKVNFDFQIIKYFKIIIAKKKICQSIPRRQLLAGNKLIVCSAFVSFRKQKTKHHPKYIHLISYLVFHYSSNYCPLLVMVTTSLPPHPLLHPAIIFCHNQH